MPLLWTAMSYFAWGAANPSLRARVDWLSFILSQLVFGIIAAIIFMRLRAWRPVASGVIGGIVGGLLMPLPAMLWGVISRTWHLVPGQLARRDGDAACRRIHHRRT